MTRRSKGNAMHKLLTNNPGQKMFLLGNEAIARGAIEAGVAVATTYPGTPSSEISLMFFQVSKETDLYFEYSTNEKTALEVAAASATSGVRTMCMMKHVGLNVAADTLMTLAYTGVKGGLVILSADDPFMFSSQNEQDNRYYGKLSGLPVLEPSSVEEAKAMIGYAFDLSEKVKEPVLFRTTTRINHSNAVIELKEIRKRQTMGDFSKDPLNYMCVPAVSRNLHVKLLNNQKAAKALSEATNYNFIEGDGPLGVICNGVSYAYASDAVSDLSLSGKVKILRIGFSHPMPEAMIKSFLKTCEKVLIIEEGEPVMEETVKAFAQEAGLLLPISGKGESLFSHLYEFSPRMVREKIAAYFNIAYTPTKAVDTSALPQVPNRPPNLCAGCSHRATYYAVKKAAEGMETIYPSDIGCYALGFLPPLSMGDYSICMGASVGTACGFSKTNTKKVIGFIGDSTFFHSGIPGLVNAVFNNHNFTLVILDNGITAMTGHQPNPGVDMSGMMDMDGYGRIDIETLVRAMGVKHVTVVKPYKVKKSIDAIKEALNHKGVSVIISREPCTLWAKGLKILKPRAFTVTDKCKNHMNCVNELACPAFVVESGKVSIDSDMCVGCAVCAQICPENAILPVKAV